jgi:nucleoside-diphosphate-sugar epimerase
MRVLIAGCGDLGTEAGLRFAAEGHRVLGVRRSPEKLPDDIAGFAADLSEPLPELPDDVEVLVYAAAADGRTEQAYRRAYVDGPRHVLDALDRAGAPLRRVLMVSSTGVYGITDGSEVDEDTPTEPTSASGAVLVEAERGLHDRRPDATVFRLAGVYGPGRTRLIDQVRDGSAVIPDPPVHTNRIHRDDAARAIVQLTTGDTSPPRVLIGVDHDPAERGEVLRFLADELGLPHPPTGGDGRSRGGDKRCRNDRLLATGFRFTYPTFREGYRAMLAGVGTRHL